VRICWTRSSRQRGRCRSWGWCPWSSSGYLINQAQTTDRTDIMFGCLAIYAILGLLADALVRFLERTLLAWRHGFRGA